MAVIGGHAFRQTMTGRCYVDTLTAGSAFGSARPAQAYTDGTDVWKCRVEQHSAKEVMGESKVEIATSTIWVDRDATIPQDSRIRVTRRNHRTLSTPETYAVIAIADKGYAFQCECREAKGKTAQ